MKIIIGTIPIIPVGFMLYQTGLIYRFRDLEVIGWINLIFAIFLYVSDKSKLQKKLIRHLLINPQSLLGCFKYFL